MTGKNIAPYTHEENVWGDLSDVDGSIQPIREAVLSTPSVQAWGLPLMQSYKRRAERFSSLPGRRFCAHRSVILSRARKALVKLLSAKKNVRDNYSNCEEWIGQLVLTLRCKCMPGTVVKRNRLLRPLEGNVPQAASESYWVCLFVNSRARARCIQTPLPWQLHVVHRWVKATSRNVPSKKKYAHVFFFLLD